jgi:yeast amino acid transporter
LVIYFAHRIYARQDPWAHPSEEVDLQTGLEEVEAGETPAPVYTKWYQKLRVVFE